MSIEQNTNMQELRAEDYTKVYGGDGHSCLIEKDVTMFLPEIPIPPSGHKVEI